MNKFGGKIEKNNIIWKIINNNEYIVKGTKYFTNEKVNNNNNKFNFEGNILDLNKHKAYKLLFNDANYSITNKNKNKIKGDFSYSGDTIVIKYNDNIFNLNNIFNSDRFDLNCIVYLLLNIPEFITILNDKMKYPFYNNPDITDKDLNIKNIIKFIFEINNNIGANINILNYKIDMSQLDKLIVSIIDDILLLCTNSEKKYFCKIKENTFDCANNKKDPKDYNSWKNYKALYNILGITEENYLFTNLIEDTRGENDLNKILDMNTEDIFYPLTNKNASNILKCNSDEIIIKEHINILPLYLIFEIIFKGEIINYQESILIKKNIYTIMSFIHINIENISKEYIFSFYFRINSNKWKFINSSITGFQDCDDIHIQEKINNENISIIFNYKKV